MKTETLEYCRDAGPFQVELTSIPCLILAGNGEIIAESEDQDVAEYIADALNEARRPMGNPAVALGAAPRRRLPAGNTKPKKGKRT